MNFYLYYVFFSAKFHLKIHMLSCLFLSSKRLHFAFVSLSWWSDNLNNFHILIKKDKKKILLSIDDLVHIFEFKLSDHLTRLDISTAINYDDAKIFSENCTESSVPQVKMLYTSCPAYLQRQCLIYMTYSKSRNEVRNSSSMHIRKLRTQILRPEIPVFKFRIFHGNPYSWFCFSYFRQVFWERY